MKPLIRLGGMLAVWAFMAADASGNATECSPDEVEKDGLCGHALAAIARIEADRDRPRHIAIAAQDAQDDTDITHCFLDIEVLLSPNSISGSNTLDVTSRTDGLTHFTLDLYRNMNVSSVLVNGASAGFTRPTDQILIDLGGAYDIDQTFQVKVFYNGLPNSTGSMDSAAFTFRSHSGTTIVSSLSQGFYAHRWWPCKENYTSLEDKFTMDLWITAPSWMVVASNGALQGADTLSGNRKRTRWKETYPITTYGVSVAMTNYNKTTWFYDHAGGAMPVELYLYPESQSSALNALTNCSGMTSPLPCLVQMIATLSEPGCFGQYPFIDEKYGIAQFNTNFGLEHQTITSQGNFVERRNVHELAHSWWGNSITCKSWHHIWVNEGFARYAESLWHERKPGGSHAAYLNHMNAHRPNPANFGGVIYRENISTSGSIFSIGIVYDKGQWVMHMLRHVIGDAAFFQSLATYRSLYEGGTAGIDDYQAVVEAVTGQDMSWFFDQWIYAGGAPYYRYGWQPAQIGGEHHIRLYIQQYQNTLSTPLPLMKMPIDITLTTASGSQTHVVWLEEEESWYLLPAEGPVTGVQFDKDTWILRGAADLIPYPPGPPVLIGSSPLPGWWSLNTGISVIELQFNEDIVFAPHQFTVVGSRSGSQPHTPVYDDENYTITLHLAGPLPAGQTWTVTVSDEVRSAAGNVKLDGEIDNAAGADAFPSGDGTPGGDAVFSFFLAYVGDLDSDGDVDADDVALFSACASGANVPQLDLNCHLADLDGDGDVDQSDFGILQRCHAGPHVPPLPPCGA